MLSATSLFAVGPPAWLAARWRRRQRTPDLLVAARVWVLLAVSLIFWALVLFGPDTTVIHQGAYATELLFFAAATISLWRLSPRLTMGVTNLQCVLGLIAYAAVLPE